MSARNPGGDALTELVLKVFRLNGALLDIAERITHGTPLTAARWQVLGAVLPEALSVAAVARSMGLTRQSVQRLADTLVEDGLCEYLENPAHKRAKLLAPTASGWLAIGQIRPVQRSWAARVAASVGLAKLRTLNDDVDSLFAALADPMNQPEPKRLSGGDAGTRRGDAGKGSGPPGKAKGRSDPSDRIGKSTRLSGASQSPRPGATRTSRRRP